MYFVSSLFHKTAAINVYNTFMYYALCLKQLFVNIFVTFSMLQWTKILTIIFSCTCLFTHNISLVKILSLLTQVMKLPLWKKHKLILVQAHLLLSSHKMLDFFFIFCQFSACMSNLIIVLICIYLINSEFEYVFMFSLLFQISSKSP